jgi:ElaB/YqjD/DUF883 family membrane-anchored ribosome-binding protein
MARFFFHQQSTIRITDMEGSELPDHVEARRQAVLTCSKMVQESPDGFWGSRPWTVTVTDAIGLILWEVSMDGQGTAATA